MRQVHALDPSITQATPVIQNWAWAITYALPKRNILREFINHVGQIFRKSCRISSSTSSPPTFQRIQGKVA